MWIYHWGKTNKQTENKQRLRRCINVIYLEDIKQSKSDGEGGGGREKKKKETHTHTHRGKKEEIVPLSS